jgi:hypothetical protein
MQYTMDKIASAYELAMEKQALRVRVSPQQAAEKAKLFAEADEKRKRLDLLRRGATHAADTSSRWGIKPGKIVLSSFDDVVLEHLEELLKVAANPFQSPAAKEEAKRRTSAALDKIHKWRTKGKQIKETADTVRSATETAKKIHPGAVSRAFAPRAGAPKFIPKVMS